MISDEYVTEYHDMHAFRAFCVTDIRRYNSCRILLQDSPKAIAECPIFGHGTCAYVRGQNVLCVCPFVYSVTWLIRLQDNV